APHTGPTLHPDPAGTADPAPRVGAAAPVRPPQQREAAECRNAALPDPPGYELSALRLPELRTLLRGSQRDEADLSYVRRLLHGRIDIIRAELTRRTGHRPQPGGARDRGAGRDPAAGIAGGEDPGFVDRLSGILADAPSAHRSSARHVTVSTPHREEYRLLAADMLADVELSDLGARTDDELGAAMGRLARYEQRVSRRRQLLQRTADDCGAEIARRYREGEAQVDDLLT
ncbi:AmfC protein, partial [Streptomyces sp. NPDC058953]